MLAIGGIIGSIRAAFLTENYHPNASFGVSAFIGIFLVFNAVRLDAGVEQVHDTSEAQR